MYLTWRRQPPGRLADRGKVCRALSGRVGRREPHVGVAPGPALIPLEGGLDGGARMAGAFEEVERDLHDRSLHRGVVRLAAGIAERKVGEHETRHAALLHDVA